MFGTMEAGMIKKTLILNAGALRFTIRLLM